MRERDERHALIESCSEERKSLPWGLPRWHCARAQHEPEPIRGVLL